MGNEFIIRKGLVTPNSIFKKQSIDPSNPNSGYVTLWVGNDGVVYKKDDLGNKTAIGEASAKTSSEISQTFHGFDNDFVYYDSSSNQWEKAIATSIDTCATHFAVRIDDDTFDAVIIGEIDVSSMTDDSSASLIDGEYYQLSQTTAGKVTNTVSSGVIQDILKVYDTNKGAVICGTPFQETENDEEIANIVLASQIFG